MVLGFLKVMKKLITASKIFYRCFGSKMGLKMSF